jgi:two-component system LytT family response regulator
MTLHALVIDDEPLARRRIARLLRPHLDITLVRECGAGDDAVRALRDAVVDLVFLDVQLPDIDGFAVLEAASARRPAAIVVTTAFAEYATRAFDVDAVDYLVKPFSRARFDAAITRVRAALRSSGVAAPRALGAGDTAAQQSTGSRLMLKVGHRLVVVDMNDVMWVRAARNASRVHTTTGVHDVAESIGALERLLDPGRFVRVHRSTIVNVHHIREMQPWFHGDQILIMANGAQLAMSRTYRDQLRARFRHAL